MGFGFRSPSDTSAYSIPYSLLMNDGATTTKLTKTVSAGFNTQKWTTSFWIKRPDVGINVALMYNYVSVTNKWLLHFNTDGYLRLVSDNFERFRTNDAFDSTTAWYHIVLAVNSLVAGATNQFKLYVDGEVAEFSSLISVTQGYDFEWGKAGTDIFGDPAVANQYITNIHHINGQQLDASYFGRDIGGTWSPKRYVPNYNTYDYWLDFADNGDIGNDVSGNDNDWTYVPGTNPGSITTTTPTNP